MALTTLSLTNLRNYASAQHLGFGAQLVVLTGENGAGKTNLLEAISLLTPGRGLRRASFEEITRTRRVLRLGGRRDSYVVNGEETRIGTGLGETRAGRAENARRCASTARQPPALKRCSTISASSG